ncbi:MAG TPA: hypothetical protein VKV20_12005 [Ktedonobacteraceae bacterium]|nr:hypothetical protein [Ktedonobacteraceae bacterium]
MFGHHESAQAKVLYAEMVFSRWEEEHHDKVEFVLEVHPPNRQPFRAKTTHHFHSFTPYPQVGDTVNVKYDPKSLEVQLDLSHDDRYDLKGMKHKQQAERQAEKARRDALLSAPPGTPASSAAGAGMADLDPELQELLDLEEAERRVAQSGGQSWTVQDVQVITNFSGTAASVNAQAAVALAQAEMLCHHLEKKGVSGQATILRKQQTGDPIQRFAPFSVEVQVQPDNMGFPFQSSFTTWIDTSKITLMEGSTLPVKYDPQNPSRMVFLFPA